MEPVQRLVSVYRIHSQPYTPIIPKTTGHESPIFFHLSHHDPYDPSLLEPSSLLSLSIIDLLEPKLNFERLVVEE